MMTRDKITECIITKRILINKLEAVFDKYPELLQPEMFDGLDIFENGADKHGLNNYLEPNGTKCSINENCASLFRHLAKIQAGIKLDSESGKPHFLHIIVRATIGYIRQQRGLVHEDDLSSKSV